MLRDSPYLSSGFGALFPRHGMGGNHKPASADQFRVNPAALR
jgi:hypothetical protein